MLPPKPYPNPYVRTCSYTYTVRLNALSKRASSAFAVRSASRCRGRLSSSSTAALLFADPATGASYTQRTGTWLGR